MLRTLVVVATVFAAIPTLSTAQQAIQLGVGNVSVDRSAGPLPDVGPDPYYGKRLSSAAIGGLMGAVAGGGLVALASSGCERDCFGYFMMAIGGAMLGATVGSAFGASAPEGRGRCTRTQRFGMGFGGAFLGAIPSIIFPPMILVSAPVGSVTFMRNC